MPGTERHSLIISSNSNISTSTSSGRNKIKRSNKVMSLSNSDLVVHKCQRCIHAQGSVSPFYTNTLQKKRQKTTYIYFFIYTEIDFSFYSCSLRKRPNSLYLYL